MDFRDVEGNKIEAPEKYDWRLAVYGVLIENGKILVIQPNWDDKYCFPGGSVNLGENLKESLKREFFEETGYKVEVEPQPMFVDSSLFGKTDADLFFQRINLYYKVERNGEREDGDIDEEVVEMHWKNLDELSADDFTFFQRDFLKTILTM